ncbi:MAG TPA: hypothetical protein VF123_09575 [Candidatus Sulfotelmatobacter sp.]
MSEWTAKKAAVLGVVFSGTSVAFLFATAVAMHWQHGSGSQKDWGMVFGVAFGVTFACCSLAALLSFFVSVSLVTYKRFFGLGQVSPDAPSVVLPDAPSVLSPDAPSVVSEPARKVRHPAIIALAGWAILIASVKFGAVAIFFVGLPAALVASAVAGGARSPTKIPLRDAVLYVCISVAIVVGILVYAMYHH